MCIVFQTRWAATHRIKSASCFELMLLIKPMPLSTPSLTDPNNSASLLNQSSIIIMPASIMTDNSEFRVFFKNCLKALKHNNYSMLVGEDSAFSDFRVVNKKAQNYLPVRR